MARTRLIKPEFFKHGDLFDLEQRVGLPLRIAFAGLWCQADRAGRFAWKPRELKTDVLPYDAVDFEQVLDALEAGGFLQSYVVDGKRFGVIPTLTEHQHFHVREGASKLPAPPQPGASTVQAPGSHRSSTPVVTSDTDTDSDTEEKRSAAVADAPRKPSSLDRLPKAVCDAAWEAWTATIGAVDYGRFRKALLPAYQTAHGTAPTGEELVNSIHAFDEVRSADKPAFQAKYTIALWASQLASYVRLGNMPLVDEWGEFTERGKAAGFGVGV